MWKPAIGNVIYLGHHKKKMYSLPVATGSIDALVERKWAGRGLTMRIYVKYSVTKRSFHNL